MAISQFALVGQITGPAGPVRVMVTGGNRTAQFATALATDGVFQISRSTSFAPNPFTGWSLTDLSLSGNAIRKLKLCDYE